MASVQVSFDDYIHSDPRTPSYELSATYGYSQYPSSLHHAYLDESTSGAHLDARFHQLHPDAAYSAYLAEQHDALSGQYYMSAANSAFFEPHHLHSHHQPSQPSGYQDLATWHANDGPSFGAQAYDPAPNPAVMHTIDSAIGSSHTTLTQRANLIAQAALHQQQVAGPSQAALSGSLDPNTYDFRPAVPHDRQRTAQACEKCRARKAKCSGGAPCERCVSRGLQCEYAPERKMRGPNKHKRKSSNAPPPSDNTLIPPSRRARASSVSSSTSDGATSDHAPDGSPASVIVNLPDHSSAHSSPAPATRTLPSTAPTSRRRAATVGSFQRPAFKVSPLSGSPAQALLVGARSRPRPPPLNLASARDYVPPMLAQYARSADQAHFPAEVSGRDSRPTSLPPYLLESYSRIALAIPESEGSRSHDMTGYLQTSPQVDALSVYSHTRTNSSDASAPITPISLSFDGSTELQYPDDIPPSGYDNSFGHFGSTTSDQPFGGDVDSGRDTYRPTKSAQGSPLGAWAVAVRHGQLGQDGTPRGVDDADMSRMAIQS